MRFLLAVCLASLAMAQDPDPLSHVAKEAETFANKVTAAVTQETMEQRTDRAASPRTDKSGRPPAGLRLTRTIVSEYTVAPLKDSGSKDLVEFRQVVSVDGHPVQSSENARHALSLGILTTGESARKRMIEDFAKYGLVDVATDYALILLAFTSVGQQSLQILPAGEDRVGSDDALIFAWTQSAAGAGELSFDGKQSARLPLTGKLFVRKSDGVPLRVSVWAVQTVSGHSIRDEATIDYVMSSQGFVAPVSVVHHHMVDGQMRTHNTYRYEPFKVFRSDIDIRYDKSGAQPPPK